jgi:hypothetical protein
VVVRHSQRQSIEVGRPPFDLERIFKGSGGVEEGYLMKLDRGSMVIFRHSTFGVTSVILLLLYYYYYYNIDIFTLTRNETPALNGI